MFPAALNTYEKVFYILTLRKTYCKRISVLFFMHHAKVLNFPVFFLMFLSFSLLFRKHTATVILSVQMISVGQFDRAFIAIFLFEIRQKIRCLINAGKLLADLIKLLRIFQWAD